MLEARSAYGWYGEAGGATGEEAPKTPKNGWRFTEWLLTTNEPEWKYNKVLIKACDREHAMKQAKAYCKTNGCDIVSLERG